MKKLFLIAITAMLISSSVKAQEEPSGNFAIDLTFQPAAIFDAGAGSMFNMPMLKVRYFLASDLALRLGLDADFYSDKEYLDVDGNDYTKEAENTIFFSAGIEKHFSTGKFSPYLGGDLSFVNSTSREVSEIGGTKIETLNDMGYLGFGLHAALGADFYVLPNFYIGAEFSPGFYFYKDKDTKVDGDVTIKGGRDLGFNLSSSSGLRIGFRF